MSAVSGGDTDHLSRQPTGGGGRGGPPAAAARPPPVSSSPAAAAAAMKRTRFASRDGSMNRYAVEDGGDIPDSVATSSAAIASSTVERGVSLSVGEAAFLLSLAVDGKSFPERGRKVVRGRPQRPPRGGERFIFKDDGSTRIDDGHGWREVYRKSHIVGCDQLAVEVTLSYFVPVEGAPVSPKFRRETFSAAGWILVVYSGDHDNNRGVARKGTGGEFSDYNSLPKDHRMFSSLHRREREKQSHVQHQPPPQQWSSTTALFDEDKYGKLNAVDRSLLLSTHAPQPLSASNLRSRPQSRVGEVIVDNRGSFGSGLGWQQELAAVAEELAGGKVVKNLTVFPSLQLTLIHPDMTKEFENCCKVFTAEGEGSNIASVNEDHEGIKLFYDTTFSFGRVYATVLTFVNGRYEGGPVMPLAVNLHERKFKSSHQLFWARIVGDLPALQKYRFPLIIDDAEPAVHLAVRSQAPNLVQLEAWTHRFRDIDTHLRSKGYGEEAIRYYKACVNYLLKSESKQAMHDRFRKEFESVWPKDFVYYYRQRLLPRSGRLGRWAMLKMNIRDELFLCPHANPQDEFHALCGRFAGWEQLSVSQLTRAFYFLFLFYVTEASIDGGSGGLKLKRQFEEEETGDPHRSSALLRSSYKYIPHPSQIRNFIKQNYPERSSMGLRAVSAIPPSSQWLAYGATELFAGLAAADHRTAAAAAAAATAAAANTNRQQQQMEDVCDIQMSRLEDLLHENDLLAFSDLTLGPSPPGATHLLSQQQQQQHPRLSPPPPLMLDQGGAGFNSLLSAAGLVPAAPPSPAPNGKVPSPALLRRVQDDLLYNNHGGSGGGGGRTTANTSTIMQQQGNSIPPQPGGLATGGGGNNSGSKQQQQQVNNTNNGYIGLTPIPELPSDTRPGTRNEDRNSLAGELSHSGSIRRKSSVGSSNGRHRQQQRSHSSSNGEQQHQSSPGRGQHQSRSKTRNTADRSRSANHSSSGSNNGHYHPHHRQSGSHLIVTEEGSPPRHFEEDNVPLPSPVVERPRPTQPPKSAPDQHNQGGHRQQKLQSRQLQQRQHEDPQTIVSTASSSLPSSSLMLWKKVQTAVVYGGQFIAANKEARGDVVTSTSGARQQ